MSGQILRATRPGSRVTAALALGVTLGLVLLFTFSYGAQAQDSSPTPEATAVPAEPPLGDCYGGVLSEAPLHCYALEQAEAAGVIDVDSIYLAGARLYIFVGGEMEEWTRAITVEWGGPTAEMTVYEGIAEKIKEFARLWPGRVQSKWLPYWPNVCDPGDSDSECLIKKTGSIGSGVLDHVQNYDSLYLMAGTGEDRTAIRGWAGWTRLWPATQEADGQDDAESGRGERAPIPTSFDISDVDTTNFPELDCDLVGNSRECYFWSRNVQRGIHGVVGVRATSPVLQEGTLYIELHKDSDNPEVFEATKAELIRLRDNPGGRPWIFIPVPYTYPELWKWGVILDRFSKSRGNTIGITSAGVHHNFHTAFYYVNVGLYRVPMTDGWTEGEGVRDYSLERTTIAVGALDAYQVRDALPVLLPQLGIPVEAVGVIMQDEQKRVVERPDQDTSSDGNRNSTSDQAQPKESAATDGVVETSELTEDITYEGGRSAGSTQGQSIQDTEVIEISQPDPADPSDLSAPLPGDESLGFGWWVWFVVGVGVVGLVLVVWALVKVRLRSDTF